MSAEQNRASRREFVKRATYVAPAILTLTVAPSYAKAGSVKPGPAPAPELPRPPTLWEILRRLLGL
jgi:hypothetical protein